MGRPLLVVSSKPGLVVVVVMLKNWWKTKLKFNDLGQIKTYSFWYPFALSHSSLSPFTYCRICDLFCFSLPSQCIRTSKTRRKVKSVVYVLDSYCLVSCHTSGTSKIRINLPMPFQTKMLPFCFFQFSCVENITLP